MKKKNTAAPGAPGEKHFKNLLDVLDYLKAEGWKIGQAKLYADKNKINKERDGSYTQKAADTYAKMLLSKIGDSNNKGVSLAEEKAGLERDLLEEKKRKEIRENEIEEGRRILKSEAEQKHTAKLALFLTAVDNFVRGHKIDEAVDLVQGDRTFVPELRNFLLKEFRDMLYEYAKRPAFAIPKQGFAEAEEFIKDAVSK